MRHEIAHGTEKSHKNKPNQVNSNYDGERAGCAAHDSYALWPLNHNLKIFYVYALNGVSRLSQVSVYGCVSVYLWRFECEKDAGT